MQFQLDVTLTEADYLAFNDFHALESTTGKKQTGKARAFLIIFMAILTAAVILILGWTTFSIVYAVLLGLATVLYMLLFNRIVKRNIRAQVKWLKKTGKLPFDAESKLEFYEDRFVELTAAKRVEQGYTAIERVCVVGERYIFLYNSSVGAYILPIPQIRAQLSRGEFLHFISSKCSNIEYYNQ